jgi:hypothetical protein
MTFCPQNASDDWPFPFSIEEWSSVEEAARDIVNASFQEDPILRAAGIESLKELLANLESRYGPHPVITETLADYTENPEEQVRLYCKARDEAANIGGPIHTIQIALAQVLLEEMNDPEGALAELLRGEHDLQAYSDENERREADRLRQGCELKQNR